jgi:NADH-quinone oxidoreductase subunit L
MWLELTSFALGASLALPALALVVLGLAWLFGDAPEEPFVARLATGATGLSALLAVAGTGVGALSGAFPLEVGPLTWFGVGHYAFELTFRWDLVSLVMVLGVTILSGLVVAFSTRYLHRERGFFRYFVAMLTFAFAMHWLVVAGSYDQLFVGWELVGLTSILLVSFFHERAAPVSAAIRVMISYRFADLGLLLGAVAMHQAAHGTRFGHVHAEQLSSGQATTIALLMLLAASGKAAQLPFSGWLPRAMEGPTTSSAVFYGGLSVHAGIYLLIRSAPLFQASLVASIAAVAIGGGTALAGAVLSRVQPDAKGSLAWASASQLGLMVVEIGLHLPELALAHLVGHASLRCFQLLRAPSLLHDSIALRKALGSTSLALGTRPLPPGLYRALREGLFLDALLDRWVVRPTLALGHGLQRFEAALARLVGGAPPDDPTPPSRVDRPSRLRQAELVGRGGASVPGAASREVHS